MSRIQVFCFTAIERINHSYPGVLSIRTSVSSASRGMPGGTSKVQMRKGPGGDFEWAQQAWG